MKMLKMSTGFKTTMAQMTMKMSQIHWKMMMMMNTQRTLTTIMIRRALRTPSELKVDLGASVEIFQRRSISPYHVTRGADPSVKVDATVATSRMSRIAQTKKIRAIRALMVKILLRTTMTKAQAMIIATSQ